MVGPVRCQFMRQSQIAGAIGRTDLDADVRHIGRMLRHTPSKCEPMRAIEHQVLAGVFNVLIAAPLGKDESAADARIDVDADHLAQTRAEPLRNARGVDPSVEDGFGRASDMPRYLDLKRSDRAHGGPRRQLTCRTW